jgi:subtilisin family serine protease
MRTHVGLALAVLVALALPHDAQAYTSRAVTADSTGDVGFDTSIAMGAHAEDAAKGDIIPGRYIVLLKESRSPRVAAARHGLRPQVVYESALRGFAGHFSDQAVRRLRADAAVLSVEPDRLVTVDDLHASSSQTLPTGIDRVDADLNPAAKIDGVDDPLDVDIAIIDTGIQPDHPDLRVAGGVRFLGEDCSGGSWADDHGHGTHVAGTAAAIDNSIGVVGVAPGARLWAIKVLNQAGQGPLSCVIAGVDWVTANAETIEVANMSLGGVSSPILCQAITASADAGVVYAVAAGNSAMDAGFFSPANCPDVLTTSAIADFDGQPGGLNPQTVEFSFCTVTGDDVFACFSNWGPLVDIAAPGVNIYSTFKEGGYATRSGTSMASPHVAGVAALDILVHGKPTDATGTAAVRSRLIAAGAPQGGPAGFTGDPDSFSEPLLYRWPLVAHALAVTSLDAPSPVVQGDLVSVAVGVANRGTSSETFTVSLTASGGAVSGSPQEVTLATGSSTTLTFTWDTAGLGAGDYTLTAAASVIPGEANSADNSRSSIVRVRLPEHDVAVTAINAPAVVVQGSTASVEVTAANPGTFDETFSVSLDASGGGVGGSPQPVTLAAGSSTTVSFTWDTTGLSPAEYTLTATASVVPGEVDTADNSSSTAVSVRLPFHDVAVTAVSAPTAVGQGESVSVAVVAANPGDFSETFSVSLEASGGSVSGSPQPVTLAAGSSTTVAFTWDTAGAALGTYTLTGTAESVAGEDNTENNTFTVSVLVTMPAPGFAYVLSDPSGQAKTWFGVSVAMGDTNGDGEEDIAVGAYLEDVNGNTDQGRAYVFFEAAGSLLFTLDIPNPQASTRFAYPVAVGDTNGDGKADIAVGAFLEDVGGNTNQGQAYVFSGADGSLLLTLDTPNAQADGHFGYSLAMGDTNGDGWADIAVGAQGEVSFQGRAYVFSGADGSLLLTLNTPNAQAWARFGGSVAMEDVNGDGKADIAVGAYSEGVGGNSGQGRAYVFSGADGSLLFTLDTPNPQADLYFGRPLAMGDTNGDGKADIAVGASLEDVGGNSDQGRAYVFSGADGSLLFTLDTPNPQAGLRFGDALAMGDTNGDGKADFAVGAPYEHVGDNEDQGRAYVFSGADGSLLFILDTPSPSWDDYFGYSLTVGDVNGDGKDDIAVGAPSREAVYVFAWEPGYAPTPTPTPTPSPAPIPPVGGIAKPPDVSDSSATNHAALAGLTAAALLALTAGAWYAGRRWLG